jgi:hypothetical protein
VKPCKDDAKHLEDLYKDVVASKPFPVATEMSAVYYGFMSWVYLTLGEFDKALETADIALKDFSFEGGPQFAGWVFYCGYFIFEVYSELWKQGRSNRAMVSRLSRSCHKVCSSLRRIARTCTLAR